MSNGSAVNQAAVDAAVDDWKSHQLKVEAETRAWRALLDRRIVQCAVLAVVLVALFGAAVCFSLARVAFAVDGYAAMVGVKDHQPEGK